MIAAFGGHWVSNINPMNDPVIEQAAAADTDPTPTVQTPPTPTASGIAGEWQDFMVRTVEMVSRLTGPDAPSRTDQRWNIFGTDLGSSFMHDGRIHMVFGDTWGREGAEGADWRSNTMAIVEPDPDYGYVVVDAITAEDGDAIELLHSLKQSRVEKTVIPHSGISIDGRMYLHYMSIREWAPSGWGYQEPVSNGSGFAWSDDNGQTWTKDDAAFWPGNNAFTQGWMVEHGGHVYVFGTPAGRFGAVKLMRVPRDSILNPSLYTYWTGNGWRDDPNYAAEVVPAPAGELSVRWSEHHQRWIMMYLNDVTHTIVLRTADQIEGPWSEEHTVVSAEEYPTLYAPFMLPITGDDIYFAMSIFEPGYQVYIMKLTL